MNTAVRVHNRGSVPFVGFKLSTMALLFCALLSAFAVVYAKDVNRRLFIRYERLMQQEQTYQVQWSQLLLEKSAWSAQARIQKIAQTKLNMRLPRSNQIILLKTHEQN